MELTRWQDVFDGPEERAFFIGPDGTGGLARSEADFLSVADLVEHTGLAEARVRELISKYQAQGLVVESRENPGDFAYFHRVVSGSDTFRLRRAARPA